LYDYCDNVMANISQIEFAAAQIRDTESIRETVTARSDALINEVGRNTITQEM
jgi:hypothetical protein